MAIITKPKRKSIKEYNTIGMTLCDRERLFESVEPIPIGELVYKAGDAFDYTEVIKVNKANQKEVTMFWNSLYFDDEEKADVKTALAHAAYGEYQGMVADSWY